jgi:hypothetical protein
MIEEASPSETLINVYQNTRRNNPEDSHLHKICSCFISDIYNTGERKWITVDFNGNAMSVLHMPSF